MVDFGNPAFVSSAQRVKPGANPLIAICAGLLALALGLFDPRLLNDGDTYWHLAAGQWILAHGQAPSVDPFSFTHLGQPWVAHEWLSEVLVALAFRLGGWSGLQALAGLALALTVLLLARAVGRRLSGLSLVVALILGVSLGAASLLARPHLLAAPLLVVWLDELLKARDAGRAPPLWLVPLMTLWANLHGSFVFGFLLTAPFALEALVEARARPWPALRSWGLFGLLCVAAALITPNGLAAFTYPFSILGMQTLGAITEWRPQDFARPGLFETTLLATLFIGMTRGVRVPPLRMALLLLLLHMALQHHRHELVLGLLAPILLAEPLARALGQPPPSAERGRFVWAATVLAAAALVGVRLALPVTRSDGASTPAAALAHVPAALAAQPVINSYGFGGYLIFRGVRPFIDGRSDMYGDAFFRRHIAMSEGDLAAFDAAVQRYGVAWTLLRADEPLARALDHHPGWRVIYRDRWAVAHARVPSPQQPGM